MRQKNRTSRFGRVACAFTLSILMAAGPMMEGAAWTQYAYAVDTASSSTVAPAQTPNAAGEDGDEVGSEGAKDASGNASSSPDEEKSQLREEVALEETPKAGAGSETPPLPGTSASNQIAGEVELTENDASAKIGSIVYDGLTYDVQPDGATVALAGFDGEPSRGDVVVPAFVMSGSDRFAVTSLADGAFEGCADVASVSLPASVERIARTAFDGAASLMSIQVNKKNEHFSSHDGMLFDREGASLVRCPQGKAGTAVLPASVLDASPEAFDGCSKLVGVQVVAGSATYASIDGMLCSADLSQLVFCPAGAGDAVSVAPSVRVIGPKAFAACAVASVAALGNVLEIADDAFSHEVRARAVVALPGGEDYEARKAVWEAAGFSQFVEPANPGDVSVPESSGDGSDAAEAHGAGLVYEVREDYTLAVSWQGAEGPEGDLEIPAAVELGGVSYRVSAVAPAGFAGSASLVSVALPASVTTVGEAAFAGCSSLASAALPDGLREVGERAFEATALADAWLPASVMRVGERAFASCGSLARVVALGAPEVASDALAECAGVSVYCPSGAQASWNVGLPAAGNHLMPYGVDLAADPLRVETGASASIFDGGSLEAPASVEVSYSYGAKPLSVDPDGQVAGKAEGASEVSVALSLESVELARATRAAEVTAAPNATALALLDDSDSRADVWPQTFAADAVLTGDDLPPAREGQVFTLWYTDEACTTRFDYSKPLADQASSSGDGYMLYGKYEAGTLEGSLPTVGDVGSASWSLSDAGTLYIRGGADAVIDDFGYIQEDGFVPSEGVWSPYRSKVKKASMALGLNAVNTVYWFAGMKSLTDVSEVYIPGGVTVASRMFDQDSRLAVLPETFVLPEGVEIAQSLFRGCPLEAIPEGFRLPSTIQDVNSMFANAQFASIPETFELPESLVSVRWLFSNCKKLASLPEGFALPVTDHRLSAGYLFNGCRSLASLPENFTIPPNAGNYESMFINCTSLTTLPRNFSLPSWSTGQLEQLFFCDIANGQPRVALYYEGDDPSVLNFDWESQNRTLVTDAADMGDFGMQRVTFKVQSADEAAGFPWETRSTAWTNKQGVLMNPGIPQLDGYTFTGWCVDEDCLDEFAFDVPLDRDTTLYGKWIKRGGRDTVVGEGQLPVKAGTGEAWWQIAVDGTLMIMGDGVIEHIPWTWNGGAENDTHWRAYRNDVSRIAMAESVRAEEMNCWFQKMPNLTDIEGVRIPEMATNVGCLFFNCNSLERIPVDFGSRLSAADITKMDSVFNNCGEIKTIPESFRIPASAASAACLFQGTSIESVPEAFAQSVAASTRLANMNAMFKNCRNLQYLPSAFAIPEVPGVAVNATELFRACSSLRSLPEGFSLPDSLRLYTESGKMSGMKYLFSGCNNLAYLPESFDFPLDAANASNDPFMNTATGEVETYFAGGAGSTSNVNVYDWTKQNRTLVTTVPDGQARVNLYLPDDAGVFGDDPWTVQLVTRGSAIAKPVVPSREGFAFLDWYVDKDYTTKFDFATATVPAEGLELYARYTARSGALPTVGEPHNDDPAIAGWSLSLDGVLDIHTAKGQVIADLGWTDDTYDSGYWGPLRRDVKLVEMSDGIRVERSMAYWFAFCSNLKRLPDSFTIADGVEDVSSLLDNCSSLEELPSSFTLPDTVTAAEHLLRSCKKIVHLPASFTLPIGLRDAAEIFSNCTSLESVPSGVLLYEGVGDIHSMFYQCYRLKNLPSSFTIPKSATLARNMFFECRALESLPLGFSIPDECASTEYRGMFYGCQSLKTLPEGFTLPSSGRDFSSMFWRCNGLTWLPASFDLSRLDPGANLASAFTFSVVGGGSTSTCYAGSDLSKLLPAGASGDAASYWAENFHRILLWDGEGSGTLPENVHKVTYKLQQPGETAASNWMTTLTTTGENDAAYATAPSDPYLFGYSFSGWQVEGADGILSDFDFSQPVAGDLVLYGSYALALSMDVPLTAKVTVDASGQTTPANFDMVSNTPVELVVREVTSERAKGASALFPIEGDVAKVKLNIGLGDRTTALPVEGGRSAYVASLPAASAGKPAMLDGSIGLSLNGAQIDYQPGDDITSLAKLTWTIEAA